MFNHLTYTKKKLNKLSFLVYGLGSSGNSVVQFFKKKKVLDYTVWDDNAKLRKKYSLKITKNLKSRFKVVDYIVLSPGISLKKSKYKNDLSKYEKKIITDIDLLYLSNYKFKSIIVTGSNGKSTTCKLITHMLKKNKFNVRLGGNIGTPVLKLKIRNKPFLVIEASSFQLSHSKFICPNYGILLNISNDHVDWHGSMKEYIKSKFKLFKFQKKNDLALINDNLKDIFKKKKFSNKLIQIKNKKYKKIKSKINNEYLKSFANNENISFVYTLSKLLKINKISFLKSMKSFVGLPHRYEIFKKKNITFINDSKATTLQAAKLALESSKNIYWIVGGLPKLKDKIDLKYLKNNIIKSYIIGKNTGFFKAQLRNKVKILVLKSMRKAVIKILQDIKFSKEKDCTILLSPAAASFDQFKNFETRGYEFKKLCKTYVKKII